MTTLASVPLVQQTGISTRRQPSVSPIESYAALRQALCATADRYVRQLNPGGELRLEGPHGAFAPSLTRTTVVRGQPGQPVPADGLLVFAIDLVEPSYVSGEVGLLPDANLRPGLRASILSDDTLVGAPMVSAPDWGTDDPTAPAPRVVGRRPTRAAPLSEWLLTKGRHYLTIAGPHTRAAGGFQSLTLRTRSRAVRDPIYSFAFVCDLHIGVAEAPRREAMNRVMTDVAASALRATLEALVAEGIDLVVLGGDLTDQGTRDEYRRLADATTGIDCRYLACLGEVDANSAASRDAALDILADAFPSPTPDYAFTKAPIRFIVMEPFGNGPSERQRKQEWLAATLASDHRTPTMFVWHVPPYHRGGVSSCGYRLPDRSAVGRELVLDLLQRAPNVFATLNGQGHWDEVDYLSGVTHIQNAAFAEWPNTYRVFRVYSDRVEWEVRQVGNRGVIRESLLPNKALTWMIATRETDLTGQAMLRRPAP